MKRLLKNLLILSLIWSPIWFSKKTPIGSRWPASLTEQSCFQTLNNLVYFDRQQRLGQLWQNLGDADSQSIHAKMNTILKAKSQFSTPLQQNNNIITDISKLELKQKKRIANLIAATPLDQTHLTQEEIRLFVAKLYKLLYGQAENSNLQLSLAIERVITRKLQEEALVLGLERLMHESFSITSQRPLFKRFLAKFMDKFVRYKLNYAMTIFNNVAMAKLGAFPSMLRGLDFRINPDDVAKLLIDGTQEQVQVFYKRYQYEAATFVISYRLRYLSAISVISLYFVFQKAYDAILEENDEEAEQIFKRELDNLDQNFEAIAVEVMNPMLQDYIDSYHAVHGKNPSSQAIEQFQLMLEN